MIPSSFFCLFWFEFYVKTGVPFCLFKGRIFWIWVWIVLFFEMSGMCVYSLYNRSICFLMG